MIRLDRAVRPLRVASVAITSCQDPGRPSGPTSATVNSEREATLLARAALLGFAVHANRDDRGMPEWIATRWALTKSFGSLDELEAWLDRVEGSRR